jgi:hypothetical protein
LETQLLQNLRNDFALQQILRYISPSQP